MSHIAYLNPIWNVCNEQLINELQVLQNKIIKSIENKPKLTRTHTLYTNKLNIRKYNFLQTVITINKIKNKKMKFNYKFQYVGEIQNNFLRNIFNYNYRPNFFKKEKYKKSILANRLNNYNKIPNDIKNNVNERKFKQIVEKMLQTNKIIV